MVLLCFISGSNPSVILAPGVISNNIIWFCFVSAGSNPSVILAPGVISNNIMWFCFVSLQGAIQVLYLLLV